jgi:hypothetical protein
MVPTPRAEILAQPLRNALSEMQLAWAPGRFYRDRRAANRLCGSPSATQQSVSSVHCLTPASLAAFKSMMVGMVPSRTLKSSR